VLGLYKDSAVWSYHSARRHVIGEGKLRRRRPFYRIVCYWVHRTTEQVPEDVVCWHLYKKKRQNYSAIFLMFYRLKRDMLRVFDLPAVLETIPNPRLSHDVAWLGRVILDLAPQLIHKHP